MGKLNWFQKISTREVVGRVSEKDYAHRSIMRSPVTLYAITQEDGTTYRGALRGHQSTPNLGDQVEMYLKKGSVLVSETKQTQRIKPDGSVKIVPQLIVWETIKTYKVLEDIV